MVLRAERSLRGQTRNLQTSNPAVNGLIAEIILTAIFVLVVLGTTDSKKGAGNFAGLAIGTSLTLVHLVGIHYTGTSVNPPPVLSALPSLRVARLSASCGCSSQDRSWEPPPRL